MRNNSANNPGLFMLMTLVACAPTWALADASAPTPPEVTLESPAEDVSATAKADVPENAAARATASQVQPSNRQKSLDFEDSVIEGMNRDPLDSVQHVGRKDPGGAGRLYRKKPDFRSETGRTLQETGYTP